MHGGISRSPSTDGSSSSTSPRGRSCATRKSPSLCTRSLASDKNSWRVSSVSPSGPSAVHVSPKYGRFIHEPSSSSRIVSCLGNISVFSGSLNLRKRPWAISRARRAAIGEEKNIQRWAPPDLLLDMIIGSFRRLILSASSLCRVEDLYSSTSRASHQTSFDPGRIGTIPSRFLPA